MRVSGRPAFNFKAALVLVAICIVIATMFYTRNIVQKLQEKEKQIVELYAKSLEYLANVEDSSTNLTFIFENIIKPIDFPIILTDPEDKVDINNKASYRNFKFDSSMTNQELTIFLTDKIKEMDEINPPIEISYADSIVFGKIHYGDSDLIRQLRMYPYIQITVAALFVLMGYFSFSFIKKSEQRFIWVGMSKETAHQLGTPLSSLMGWSEMLRMNYQDPDKVLDYTEEIGNDLTRLNKITQRFSKIGSQPELKAMNVYEVIERTTRYFQKRLPQTGKNVILKVEGDREACALMSAELFEWVLENLIKNALDAIDSKNGSIIISVARTAKNVEIEVIDTGKGISLKRRKDIFRPGVTTKKRGWGLGLTLAKRIVEEYHRGKIFVKSSSLEGTTFKIILKKA